MLVSNENCSLSRGQTREPNAGGPRFLRTENKNNVRLSKTETITKCRNKQDVCVFLEIAGRPQMLQTSLPARGQRESARRPRENRAKSVRRAREDRDGEVYSRGRMKSKFSFHHSDGIFKSISSILLKSNSKINLY